MISLSTTVEGAPPPIIASAWGEASPVLFAEMKSYIGFSDRDAAALAAFRGAARPHFPAIADEFYAVLRAHPRALRVLGDEAQEKRLHASLQRWLDELLAGPHDDAYFVRHGRIGEVHVRVGLEQHFMVTAMSRVRASLQARSDEVYAADEARKRETALAIARVCDLDLAIMLDSFSRHFVARLERAQRLTMNALGVMAGGLAHEIRNPLNGATLHAAILERMLARLKGVPAEGFESLEVVKGELKRLSSLMTDFLEIAQPAPLHLADHDIDEIVHSVILLLGPEAASRGVELREDRAAQGTRGYVDPARFRQVLVNLVRNAIDAVDESGRVIIRAERTPGQVEVSVADTGPGIEDPDAPIFDAFFTTKERGTGLGLSIVRRIVDDHGGSIRFSTSHLGTTFIIRLPDPAR